MRQNLSITQAQNCVFIFDSFSSTFHMHNQPSNLTDFSPLSCHLFLSFIPSLQPLPLWRFLFHAWLFWSIVFLLKSPYMHLVSISHPLVQLFFSIKIISYSILINSQIVNIYSMGSASVLPILSCPQS